MTEFLITNARTNQTTWIDATTIREALVVHENARRVAAGATALLPKGSHVGTDHRGDIVEAWLGESRICGLRGHVIR